MTEVNRRDFVAGAVVAANIPLSAFAAELSDAEKENVRVVTAFCASWSTRDPGQILPFLADDCVYRMTETTPPASGHAGVIERLGSWIETSQQIEFKVIESYAKGPIVMNYRVDRFSSTTRPLTWEGVGVFFVKDGKIREWSDYTVKVDRG